MRDLLLAPMLLWIVLRAFRQPWIGVLGWTWLSIMNPHQLSWQLSSLPVAAAIGGATLLGLLITKDRKDFSLGREQIVLMLFMAWMCITLPFSFLFEPSYDLWKRVIKIDLMVLVTLVVLYSRRHLMLFIWVNVLSIAFYGVKGGAFTIATGGSFRVWGPTSTYIEGNNEVALAIVMTIPLMRFLQMQMTGRWSRHAMSVAMALMAAAALGSHSRGALLAIAAMAVVMWWRGNNKLVMAVGMLVVGGALLSMMPAEWWARMNTIETYDQDASALGRINAWWMAWNLAKDNFFGGGFMVSNAAIFATYAPDPTAVHAAHSIYFMVLGEHGFIGLFLFLLLFCLAFGTAGKLRTQGRRQPETQWLSDLGAMLQVSFAGYAVGGAFLSLSYWDLPYNMMAMAVIGQRWMANKAWLKEVPEPLVVLPAWLSRRFKKKPDVALRT
ncbi:MAG: putative O-glycosylation ligase, exosortase A system-associated [Roseateles sp.]|uniref:putative O-glycosylation ligase, exosortase A system-associated n=1 Tax=Roseateles sp. TaxID=1971397 RepID=UPI0039EBB944